MNFYVVTYVYELIEPINKAPNKALKRLWTLKRKQVRHASRTVKETANKNGSIGIQNNQ